MKFKKLEISIPQIVTVLDYHEFSEYESFLNELGLSDVRQCASSLDYSAGR